MAQSISIYQHLHSHRCIQLEYGMSFSTTRPEVRSVANGPDLQGRLLSIRPISSIVIAQVRDTNNSQNNILREFEIDVEPGTKASRLFTSKSLIILKKKNLYIKAKGSPLLSPGFLLPPYPFGIPTGESELIH